MCGKRKQLPAEKFNPKTKKMSVNYCSLVRLIDTRLSLQMKSLKTFSIEWFYGVDRSEQVIYWLLEIQPFPFLLFFIFLK